MSAFVAASSSPSLSLGPKKRVDVGVNLKGTEPTDRLEASALQANASHKALQATHGQPLDVRCHGPLAQCPVRGETGVSDEHPNTYPRDYRPQATFQFGNPNSIDSGN